MTFRFRRLAATTAGALAVALTVGSVTPAYAQLGDIDTSSLGLEEIEMIGSVVGSMPLGSALGSVGSLGSSDFSFEAVGSSEEFTKKPRPRDASITSSEFIEVEKSVGEYEYWRVTSEAMQREVILEVVPSRHSDEGPAPVLYMLDGVGAPEYNSGWNHQAHINDIVREDNVHVVMPTGAYGSYYADWQEEDEVLGYNKWETFLTQELPGIVADEMDSRGTPVNGKNGIGGISMGGQAAMHLAATYPKLYQGVMSFSGNYTTEGELAYQSVRGSIERIGGDVENMWGPRGSEDWKRHDTVSHVEGLEDTAIYFSAGNTVVGEADIANYNGNYMDMLLGLLLEAGVRDSSEAFASALDREGIDYRADFAETGFHSWHTFKLNFAPGWNYIKGALN